MLYKNGTTLNGIWIVKSGAWVRAFDMDQDATTSVPASEVLGAIVYVIAGTANGGTFWRNTNTTTPVLGTTALTFAQFGNASVDLSAIDFLVGAASGLLSGEIVAGTTPGGELGGTWPSPTVDATHSGSTHAATQAAAEATAASAAATHAAAADPHTGYVLESVMTTPADILVGGTSGAPTRLAKGSDGQVLTVDPTTHLLVWSTPAGGALTTKGDILGYSTVAARVPIGANGDVLTADSAQALGLKWAAPSGGGGGSISTVDQDISADFVTGSGSTWADVTGLTGISVPAGTWIVLVDLETSAGAAYGPVYRITDGTTIYAQSGILHPNITSAASAHDHFTSKPFVLGSTTTMKLQYFSDTAHTVKKYPSRGASSAQAATHVTFLQLA